MPTPITRRQAVQLGAMIVGGWGISQVLRRTAPIGRDVGRSGDVTAILDGDGSPSAGPAGASLRLAVFTDYRCPACRHAFPAMEEAVQKDGDVRVIYKDWPIFGPPSERAASIALASAAQGIYPAVHGRLMTDSRIIDDAMLRDVVTAAGGSWEKATAFLAANAQAIAARLRSNGQEAYAIGLSGTPGFLAGPMLVMGAIDTTDFGRLFARARAAAGQGR
jgi:protein-disulfide isomerase